MEKTEKNFLNKNKKNKIIDESMRLFLKKGYHGTSIDEISKAAELTKGAIYWYFKGKEDILRSIMKEFEKRFLENLIKTVTNVKGNFYDKIEKYFRFNAAFAYYNPELCVSFTTLAAELVGGHHKVENEFRRIYKKYRKFLSSLIIQGKEEKIIKKEIDPDLTALIIIAFHDGILIRWFMNQNEIDGETYVNTFKKIMLYGLLA